MAKTDKPVMEVVNEQVVRTRQKIRLCAYANRIRRIKETSTTSNT